MIKILNNCDVNYVSGGWVCSSTYEGKPFLKAVWFTCYDFDHAFGTCYYGEIKDRLFYSPPKHLLKGIVQKPMNFWTYAGDRASYILYACYENRASKCVFEET